MAARFDIAVAGCTSLVGEAVLEALAERRLPLGRVYALDQESQAGQKLEFRDRYLTVEPLESFDFAKVAVALFATTPRAAARYVPNAAAAGCRVVDLSGQFRQAADVGLIVPELNAQAAIGLPAGTVVASPAPAALALALALRPLQAAAGLVRVTATVCLPASNAGRAGVEELATQSAQLLNARGIKPRVFDKQLAFNLLPLVGELQEDGASSEEQALAAQLARLLEQPLAVAVTAIQVPVFYGLTAAVSVETRQPLPAAEARALLTRAAGLRVVETSSAGRYPTPVTDASRGDAVFVGRIRGQESQPRGLNFCIVVDNVRKGAAINGIQVAELLLGENE